MIKKDYLSEVEALFVQRAVAYNQNNIPRLFVIWADVGQDVHGFVARCDELIPRDDYWVVKFMPLTNILQVKYTIDKQPDWPNPNGGVIPGHTFINDPRTKTPEELRWLICKYDGMSDGRIILETGETFPPCDS